MIIEHERRKHGITGEVTVIELDTVTSEFVVDGARTPADPDIAARLTADEREQRQLDQLDTKLDALKTYVKPERLTVSDYRIDTTLDPMVDVRELARRCNDQENTIRDLVSTTKVLVRLVRGIAAEDDE